MPNKTNYKREQQTIISWTAPEFQHYQKNVAWYITLWVVTGLIALFFAMQKDIFGAVCILIFGLFVFIFSRQRPRLITVSLTTLGVSIDENSIPYNTIKHFWLVTNDQHQTLNLETSAYLNRTLIIQLADVDVETVRNVLNQVVPEHEQTEPTLAQRVMHRLKF